MLLAFGLIAFGVAGLSIADMFNRRPWDGVVPADVPGKLIVREVTRPDSEYGFELERQDDAKDAGAAEPPLLVVIWQVSTVVFLGKNV